MDWLKKRKSRASEKKQSLVRGRERGAVLLEDVIECCDGKSNPIKFYSADQIIKATDNFSESNHVFSPLFINDQVYQLKYQWYTGKNKNNDMVFIKKYIDSGYRGEHISYSCRDIAISSMVSGHKNFLKLVGCCLDYIDPVMVYHGEKKLYELNLGEEPWKRRVKIAEDIATALAYLHTAFPRPFVYRNMRLGNILLDEDGVAKLCDFSYCVSIPEGETFVEDIIVGIYWYFEPRYALFGEVSERTDVYAIGILMLKLLTGDKRYGELYEQQEEETKEEEEESEFEVEDESEQYYANWMSKSMEEIADPKMLEKMGEVSEEELFQMKSFLMLSKRCISRRGQAPTMVEVVKELKKIQRSL